MFYRFVAQATSSMGGVRGSGRQPRARSCPRFARPARGFGSAHVCCQRLGSARMLCQGLGSPSLRLPAQGLGSPGAPCASACASACAPPARPASRACTRFRTIQRLHLPRSRPADTPTTAPVRPPAQPAGVASVRDHRTPNTPMPCLCKRATRPSSKVQNARATHEPTV